RHCHGVSETDTSNTSHTSLFLSFRWWDKNASISKAFLGSASAVYRKLGCLVMSYLSERKGRTPRSCRMHLPPSITASSSRLMSSCPVFWYEVPKDGLLPRVSDVL